MRTWIASASFTPCDATWQVLTGESKDLQAAEYRKFEEECIQAFNLIRKHSARLINLFQLVRSIHSSSSRALVPFLPTTYQTGDLLVTNSFAA